MRKRREIATTSIYNFSLAPQSEWAECFFHFVPSLSLLALHRGALPYAAEAAALGESPGAVAAANARSGALARHAAVSRLEEECGRSSDKDTFFRRVRPVSPDGSRRALILAETKENMSQRCPAVFFY